ncbi:potassium channel family protein [Roseivirga echinicomitans]|uniref:potassium channel family protein n=1 Tax=Roseivirga echinicomitans TaxID=296218 RepID=UPI0012FD679B|nr:potassium channel family protein [Roseivirga echinicomitans]
MLLFLSASQWLFAQTSEFKNYSYAELFQMIESSEDSTFRLENAIIKYDQATDSRFGYSSAPGSFIRVFNNTDTIVIDKELVLTNVHFDISDRRQSIPLHHIKFNKSVALRNTSSVLFTNCTFEGRLTIMSTESMANTIELLDRNSRSINLAVAVTDSKLKKSVNMDLGTTDEKMRSRIRIENSEIWGSKEGRGSRFNGTSVVSVTVKNCTFYEQGRVTITGNLTDQVDVSGNDFGEWIAEIKVLGSMELNTSILEENTFNNHVLLDFDDLTTSSTFQWSQWGDQLISSQGYNDYFNTLADSVKMSSFISYEANDSILANYKNDIVQFGKSYKQEVKLRGKLLDLYKAQHDLEDVNTVYIGIKNLETERLAYLYSQNPSFNTFFKWKVNQFLKAFSDYGTEPSKAIVFSVNVVILFAFIYLFFPNSWDEQGKHRILHRFDFFQKYLRSKEGMNDIYLVEKKKELSEYDAFKKRIEDGKLELPRFFIVWSKPVYNAAMVGTKLTSKALKFTDILSGEWHKLSPTQKRWKNIQIGTYLIIGVGFDLSIRVLNALMLSINAFTTLGFGEIPIKGLPRYLAIIEGFIGWFMLTIFSVSLISQLLN